MYTRRKRECCDLEKMVLDFGLEGERWTTQGVCKGCDREV